MAAHSAVIDCCETMQKQLFHRCNQHPYPQDCPDVLVICYPSGNFGIPIRDGGSGYSRIKFCPWCGTKLPVLDLSEKKPPAPA